MKRKNKKIVAWSIFFVIGASLCFLIAPISIRGDPERPELSVAPKAPPRAAPVIDSMSIEDIKEMIKREGYQYNVGETWISKLSPTEMANLLGYVPPPMNLSHLSVSSTGTVKALPSAFDYRNSNDVTPPKDQDGCGSCWCFAGTGEMESKILIESDTEFDLSEENVLSCNFIGQGCGGGNDHTVVNFFSKYGASLETCAPYDASDGTPCKCACSIVRKLSGWKIIGTGLDSEDPAQINIVKQALLDYGPLYVTMDASAPGFGSYTGGVFEYWGSTSTNHAVLLIGWDDSLPHSHGTGAWIVKNSWGTSWGEGGYFKIAYGSAKFCNYVAGYSSTKEFDDHEILYYYDDAGWWNSFYSNPNDTWGAVRFIPTCNGTLEDVEFWAVDDNLNYEIYVYDTISEESSYSFSDLLSSQSGTVTKAGYYSVELSTKPVISPGNDFIVAVRFNTPDFDWPVPFDDHSPISGESYYSSDGSTWWNLSDWDVGIRAVIYDGTGLPPKNLHASWSGSGTVALRWDKMFNILGFNVYWSETSGGPYTKVNSSLVTTNNYLDPAGEGTYYYVVTAVYSVSESSYSNEVFIGPPPIQVTTWTVWERYGDIYYKTSSDDGVTWSDPQLLVDYGYEPSIMKASDDTLWLVWTRYGDIYYKTSSDNGSTWSSETIILDDSYYNYRPRISEANGRLWGTYYRYEASSDVYYVYYDGTWSSPQPLATESGSIHEWDGKIVADSTNKLYGVYQREGEIYYKTSTDNGVTWSSPIQITTDPDWDWGPCIAIDSTDKIYVVFQSWRSGNQDIWYKTSNDYGSSWSDAVQFTEFVGNDKYNDTKIIDDIPYTVWISDRSGNYDIYFGKIGTTVDPAPPYVSYFETDPSPNPVQGEWFRIRTYVEDESGISSVKLYIRVNDDPYDEIPMYNEYDGWYGADLYSSYTWLYGDYYIVAEDIDGNTFTTSTKEFTILDKFQKKGDILIVDDDDDYWYDDYSPDCEKYYEDALIANGITYDIWDCAVRGYLNNINYYGNILNEYDAVIWLTGENWDGNLTYNEKNALIDYMNNGGNLFISNAETDDISRSDPTFLQNYFYVDCVTYDTVGYYTLNGVSGDPISDGMTITIQGGDGANNQWMQDEIDPVSPAVTVFEYDTAEAPTQKMPRNPEIMGEKEPETRTKPRAINSSGSGAIRVDTGTYKVVYFAFGYEAINTQEDRNEIMGNIMDYFGVTEGIGENSAVIDVPSIDDLHLNPLQSNPYLPNFSSLIYDSLARIHPKTFELLPGLAESWSWDEGTKTMTITLRNDVTWHDGEAFTSEDVKYTYELIKSLEFPPEMGYQDYWHSWRDSLVTVNTPDPYTAEIVLSGEDNRVAYDVLGRVPILPKHIWYYVYDP
ncbi:MAG: C1 family peptidase, partial [Candidatus Thorarchaeota archaeon]